MIKFKNDTEICIVTEFDEELDNIVDETHQVFKAGELVAADIIEDTDDGYVALEFCNGVAFGVEKNCFDLVSN